MSKAASPKLSLTAPQTIPLDHLTIDNVRKSEPDDVSIAELTGDIAQRGLLQSLSVRPILAEESGTYGIQAGSRRFRALKLLVKQKKLAKNAPVPASSKWTVLQNPTASPKTPSAKRSTRSISSGPSNPWPTRVTAKTPSPA